MPQVLCQCYIRSDTNYGWSETHRHRLCRNDKTWLFWVDNILFWNGIDSFAFILHFTSISNTPFKLLIELPILHGQMGYRGILKLHWYSHKMSNLFFLENHIYMQICTKSVSFEHVHHLYTSFALSNASNSALLTPDFRSLIKSFKTSWFINWGSSSTKYDGSNMDGRQTVGWVISWQNLIILLIRRH